MQRQFDHKSVDFTLEKIIEFGFDQYAETIGDISGAATKELAIEQVRNLVHLSLCYPLLQIVPISPYNLGNLLLQGIEAIARTWESTELDITTYKDRGHFKVR